ncbi:MAG: inositol monophosphatase [Victivallaceae bacterium]
MWNADLIINLCRQASDIAFRYYDDPPMELKSDDSVVTAADKQVEAFLTEHLTSDGSSFIGEETCELRGEDYIRRALEAESCYVVDPIDGTAPYSCHFPAWGHSIGLMSRGRLTDGAIYLPVQDVLFVTDGPDVRLVRNLRSGEYRNEVFRFESPGIDLRRPVAVAQKFVKTRNLTLKNQVFCWSACLAGCEYLLLGKLMAYVAVVKLWDIAAAGAIFDRLGIVGFNEHGKKFELDVNSEFYDLDPASPDRFRLRDATCFAAGEEICRHVFAHIPPEA